MKLFFHNLGSGKEQQVDLGIDGLYMSISESGEMLFDAEESEDSRLYFYGEDDSLCVKPCGGTSTSVNGTRIDRITVVQDGDELECSDTSMTVRQDESDMSIVHFDVNSTSPATEAPKPVEEPKADKPAYRPLETVVLSDNQQESAPQPRGRRGVFAEGDIVSNTYQIVKMLGKGGMGEVYLAKDLELGTNFALKVVTSTFGDENNHALDMLRNEAKKTARLHTKNIIFVNGLKHDDRTDSWYIVMEYIDGGNLRDVLKARGKISEEQALIIVQDVASALCAAEELKIVHRDIKPDNIMFTTRGEVKLADLGIAKHYDGASDGKSWTMATGNVVGTPAYLSPEQINEPKKVDIRSDIYCLGATFFEMVAGRTPFIGAEHSLYGQILYSEVPNPKQFNPELSDWCAKLILKMMDKKQEKRFKSAKDLVDYIENGPYEFSLLKREELIKDLATVKTGESSTMTINRNDFLRPSSVINKKTILGIVGALAAVFLALVAVVAFFILSKLTTDGPSKPLASRKNVSFEVETELPRIKLGFAKVGESADPQVMQASPRGVVKCENIPKGEYVVSLAESPGYENVTCKFEATSSETIKLDVKKDMFEAANDGRYAQWVNGLLKSYMATCVAKKPELESLAKEGKWDDVNSLLNDLRPAIITFTTLFEKLNSDDAAKLDEEVRAFNEKLDGKTDDFQEYRSMYNKFVDAKSKLSEWESKADEFTKQAQELTDSVDEALGNYSYNAIDKLGEDEFGEKLTGMYGRAEEELKAIYDRRDKLTTSKNDL